MLCGKQTGKSTENGNALTKHFPCLGQTSLVAGVHDKNHSMTLVVVFWPNRPDIALSAQVKELHYCGRKMNLANCSIGRCNAVQRQEGKSEW